MAELDELSRMVMTFRVSELMTLLQYAGKNKHGRKHELQQRAIDLARCRSTPVHLKIREIYQAINAQPGVASGSVSPVAASPGGGGVAPGASGGVVASAGYPSSSSYTQNVLQGRSPFTANYKSDQTAKPLAEPAPCTNSYPTHPDVQLKPLPFFDILAELVKPTCLAPTASGRGYSDLHLSFHLSPQQADLIASNHDSRIGVKFEYTVQVQLRFCLLETSCAQDDHFPPNLTVRMNGRVCQLPNPIPSTKQGVEPKRPSRPLNVTSQCRVSPVVANSCQVTWSGDLARAYCVQALLVRRLTSHDLVHRLRARGVKSADFTRALIKEKLSEGVDDEIATTSLKCSLQCPLGKCRMTLPCRATTCTHLQCFDAGLYVQMNERKPTWTCPVCDRTCLYEHLLIDGYFTEMLKSTSSSTMDVRLEIDGSWVDLSRESGRHGARGGRVSGGGGGQQLEDSAASSVSVETLEDDSDEVKVTGEMMSNSSSHSHQQQQHSSTAAATAGGATTAAAGAGGGGGGGAAGGGGLSAMGGTVSTSSLVSHSRHPPQSATKPLQLAACPPAAPPSASAEPECIDLISDDDEQGGRGDNSSASTSNGGGNPAYSGSSSSTNPPAGTGSATVALTCSAPLTHALPGHGNWQAIPVGETRLKLSFSSAGSVNNSHLPVQTTASMSGVVTSTVSPIQAALPTVAPSAGYFTADSSALPYLGLSSITSAFQAAGRFSGGVWDQQYDTASLGGALLSSARFHNDLSSSSSSSVALPPAVASTTARPPPPQSPDVISLD